MIIRNAKLNDLDRLCVLELACFKESPWSRGMLLEALLNPQMSFIVAEEDGETLGYSLMLMIPGIEGQLCSIAVSPEHQRQGIASALLSEHLRLAREAGIGECTLEVRVSNAKAIAFYEKFGFENAGIRPGYYENGEDAYIMWNRAI